MAFFKFLIVVQRRNAMRVRFSAATSHCVLDSHSAGGIMSTLIHSLLITISGFLLGQSTMSGGSDPDEAKRGNKTISQNDEMIELNNQMVELNNKMLFFSRVSTSVAVLALLVSLVALIFAYRSHH